MHFEKHYTNFLDTKFEKYQKISLYQYILLFCDWSVIIFVVKLLAMIIQPMKTLLSRQ